MTYSGNHFKKYCDEKIAKQRNFSPSRAHKVESNFVAGVAELCVVVRSLKKIEKRREKKKNLMRETFCKPCQANLKQRNETPFFF